MFIVTEYAALRIIRLLVSSRYRRVRKMQLHFLYLFKQYLKRIIHQSFVSTVPIYGDSHGIAGVGAGQLPYDCPRSAWEVWGL